MQGTDSDKRHYIDCLCGARLICAGAGTMAEWVTHVTATVRRTP